MIASRPAAAAAPASLSSNAVEFPEVPRNAPVVQATQRTPLVAQLSESQAFAAENGFPIDLLESEGPQIPQMPMQTRPTTEPQMQLQHQTQPQPQPQLSTSNVTLVPISPQLPPTRVDLSILTMPTRGALNHEDLASSTYTEDVNASPAVAYPVMDNTPPPMIAIAAHPYSSTQPRHAQESKQAEPQQGQAMRRPSPTMSDPASTTSQPGFGSIVREIMSDMEKALFGENASPAQPNNPQLNPPSGHHRRQLMPTRVEADQNGKYDAYVTMHQPQLSTLWSTPQGKRPAELWIGKFDTEVQATLVARANAPPRWSGPNEQNSCILCNKTFALMRRAHHCRNCGFLVCADCSDRKWPSAMIPFTYHNAEEKVRVCDSCHFFMDSFRSALLHGDEDLARSTYDTGNVNLYCPFSCYNGEYPVHCAARGGNLSLLRWLLEECLCVVRWPNNAGPIKDAQDLTVLASAAVNGSVECMRYLVHVHECSVAEITNVSLLQRALHILLESPTPAPEFVPFVPAKGRRRHSHTGRVR